MCIVEKKTNPYIFSAGNLDPIETNLACFV